ncbi:MAG: 3-dehydroquinate synthase [Dehalococcoidales bacterium]
MHELNLIFPGLNTCRILVGNGILRNCATYVGESAASQSAIIITDSNVGHVYAESLLRRLEEAGIIANIITIPAGENNKNLKTVTEIYGQLARLYADRGTTIIGLGGGVVGDTAGFVASTYLRGLPLVHIPTSLLAQVDSSIGGKTGVNFEGLKNQVGTFYHAALVISDTVTLSTLPPNEFTNGVAEIIKSAVIADSELFTLLEASIDKLRPDQADLLDEAVFRTVKIKGQLVSGDEKDTSLRQLLNFGHTIGHGIETASGLSVRHGEAIAAGMIAAARISRKMNLLSSNDFLRIRSLISRAGLPLKIRGINPEDVIQAIKHDKKIKNGKMNFVLITEPGNSLLSREVTLEMIKMSILEEDA